MVLPPNTFVHPDGVVMVAAEPLEPHITTRSLTAGTQPPPKVIVRSREEEADALWEATTETAKSALHAHAEDIPAGNGRVRVPPAQDVQQLARHRLAGERPTDPGEA